MLHAIYTLREVYMHIKELYHDVIFENMDFEFKERLNKDKTIHWAKSIAAFANAEGGWIFVGADNDGLISGLTREEVDQTKLMVHREIERHMMFLPKYQFFPRNVDDNLQKFILAIAVDPSEEIIVYDNGDYNKIVYLRKDGQSVPASPQEIIQLSSKKNNIGIDRHVLSYKFRRDEFTQYFEACSEFRPDHEIPKDKSLIDIGAVEEDGNLTFAASLFKNVCSAQNTAIYCRFYAGFDKNADVLDRSEYKGNLVGGYLFMKAFIEKNIRHGFRKTNNGGQEEIVSYPRTSIDEGLINALAHRDYALSGTQIEIDLFYDRLEISSPGSCLLSKNVSEYDWDHMPSIRRNTLICDLFSLAGLMEKGGTGFLQMHKDYAAYEDKCPTFHDYHDYSMLTLYDLTYRGNLKDKTSGKTTTGILCYERLKGYRIYDDAVLLYCYETPKSRAEIQSITSYKSPKAVLDHVINPLIQAGLLISTAPGKAPNRKYLSNRQKITKK